MKNATEMQTNWWERETLTKWRGVNLGGWFVLEKWQTPSLFIGCDADSEYELVKQLPEGEGASRILNHRKTFITKSDIQWIAESAGLNSVRLPIGYWLLTNYPGWISSPELLDDAIDWCEEYGLKVILDLHSLPGHQSNQQHSGRSKPDWSWGRSEGNWSSHLQEALEFVRLVAERYRDRKCIAGLSLVNEPDSSIPAHRLLQYYKESYRTMRRYMSAERVALIITAFPENRLWEIHGKLRSPEFENVITDVHYYQCFGDWWSKLSMAEQLRHVKSREDELNKYGADGWLLVGEWSLRLPWAHPQDGDWSRNLPDAARKRLLAEFFWAQVIAYEHCRGYFFWSYKAEHPELEWSYRDCVEKGIIPSGLPRGLL